MKMVILFVICLVGSIVGIIGVKSTRATDKGRYSAMALLIVSGMSGLLIYVQMDPIGHAAYNLAALGFAITLMLVVTGEKRKK